MPSSYGEFDIYQLLKLSMFRIHIRVGIYQGLAMESLNDILPNFTINDKVKSPPCVFAEHHTIMILGG